MRAQFLCGLLVADRTCRNRDLGGLVSTFQNGICDDSTRFDVTASLPPDLLESAATNMTSLGWAKLTRNVLAARIISSLQLYPHLVDLSIQDLSPFEFIWDLKPTSLRKLTWAFNASTSDELGRIQYVASVVKATCPFLTSLDIIVNHHYPRYQSDFHGDLAIEIPKERIQYYQEMKTDDLVFGNLQHLGVRYEGLHSDTEVHDFITMLAWQHHHSLTSLCTALDMSVPEKWKTDILDMSGKLENLKELTLLGTLLGTISFPSEDIIGTITASFNRRLERFSMLDIGSPFNAELGRSFGTWTRLKYLCLGDCEMAGGPYDDDGRPAFSNYNLVNSPRVLILLV